MSKEFAIVGLLAVAGFLIGGVYTTWKTAKTLAVLLLVAAVLAAGGAVAWIAS